jgi:aspartate/glutamate racemase
MDMKKFWKTLAPIAILALVGSIFTISQCTSCQIVFTNLNEMEESEFQLLEKEVYLITKLGCQEIFKAKPELGKDIGEALAEFIPYLDTLNPDSVVFITNMIGKLTEKISSPEIKTLIDIAMLQIQKYGGFKYVEQVDLGLVLSDRSVRLIQALVRGVVDAADSVTW